MLANPLDVDQLNSAQHSELAMVPNLNGHPSCYNAFGMDGPAFPSGMLASPGALAGTSAPDEQVAVTCALWSDPSHSSFAQTLGNRSFATSIALGFVA